VKVLQDRVALLTGGGGGIGTATALASARAGAKVVVTDKRPEMAERTAALIRGEGGEAMGIPLDVLDEEQVDAVFDQAAEQFGPVDVLFNLAGDGVIVKSVDCSVEDFDRILRLNVTGQFLTARAAARRMLARGSGGSIINIASILGYGGIPRRAAYSSSRAAIINLTRTLAVEWALDGIRVNCVAPGWTMTEAVQKIVDSGVVDIEPLIERTPMGRLPVAVDIADVIVFLASDASRMVTGVTVPIDGGVTAYMGPGGKPSLA
jgi:NAD(P)-dependent dehydrogenase (short-subunit alcohol dehydrogenase family)